MIPAIARAPTVDLTDEEIAGAIPEDLFDEEGTISYQLEARAAARLLEIVADAADDAPRALARVLEIYADHPLGAARARAFLLSLPPQGDTP